MRHVLALTVDLVEQLLKCVAYVSLVDRRRFDALHLWVLIAEALGLLVADFTLTWVFLHEVQLVANKHDAHVCLGRL